jgi:uroporphyrinogen decarboxylase
VLAAMKGEELYPVPVDVYEGGVHWELRAKLQQHFGLAENDNEGLLQAFHACLRWGKPHYIGPPLEEIPTGVPIYPARKVMRDIWGTYGETVATYSDEVPRPLHAAQTVAEVEAHAWPDPAWFDYGRVGWLLDPPESDLPVAEWAKVNGDYARLAGGWSPVFSRAMDLFGMETGLTHVAEHPELIEAAIARIADFYEEFYRRFARAGRGHFDILAFGDDFATQRGLMLKPELWRQWFLPIWKRLFALGHEHGMKVAFHSCGAIRPVLADLVDIGLDILENVQVQAVGMDPAELKREFGQHLSFYGGMDIQAIMPSGSTEEVRREVRRLIDTLGVNGCYIFTTAHYLMDDVSVENTLAMYDEAEKYRR